MSSPPPDPWPSQPSAPDGVTLRSPIWGPLPVPAPPLSAEERWHAGYGAWADKFEAPLIVNASGVDRITVDQVKEYGVTRLLDELASELREGRYRPLPARRVLHPKQDRSLQAK